MNITSFPQVVRGIVVDEHKQPIDLANILIIGTNINAATNSAGEFEIKQQDPNDKLIISHIGYIPDSIDISHLYKDKYITLKTASYVMDEVVVVSSKYSFAEAIILKVIKYRSKYLKSIGSYSNRNYTRIFIKDDSKRDSNIVIYESISNGYHIWPDINTEELLTVRSGLNSFPKDVNTNIYGMIPSIYSDNVELTKINCISPINESALDYFSFELLNTSILDGKKVFKIGFAPRYLSTNIPRGAISIIDSLFQVVYIHMEIPQASFIPFSKQTEVTQTFQKFRDSLWLPTTSLIESGFYRKTSAKRINSFKLSISQLTFISNYQFDDSENIIEEHNNSTKEMTASINEKNSVYWDSVQIIPLTEHEKAMAFIIDSIYASSLMAKLSKAYNFIYDLPVRNFNDFYHFNRVEGHHIGFGINSKKYLLPLYLEAKYGYGFADKKLKYLLKSGFSLGDNYKVYASYQNDLGFFNNFYDYAILDISFRSLFYKNDYADYFYREKIKYGADISFTKNMVINASFSEDIFKNTRINTNWSFASGREYRQMPAILDGRVNYVELLFRYDNAKYTNLIVDKFKDLKQSYLSFEMKYLLSTKHIMKSDIDYYQFFFKADINSSYSALWNINVVSEIGFSKYNVPQFNFHLPANLTTLNDLSNRFRTVSQDKYLGENIISIYIQNNFSNTPLTFIDRNISIELITFINAAWIKNSKEIPNYVLTKDRYLALSEVGIAFNNVILSGVRIDFAYRTDKVKDEKKCAVCASFRF